MGRLSPLFWLSLSATSLSISLSLSLKIPWSDQTSSRESSDSTQRIWITQAASWTTRSTAGQAGWAWASPLPSSHRSSAAPALTYPLPIPTTRTRKRPKIALSCSPTTKSIKITPRILPPSTISPSDPSNLLLLLHPLMSNREKK